MKSCCDYCLTFTWVELRIDLVTNRFVYACASSDCTGITRSQPVAWPIPWVIDDQPRRLGKTFQAA